jgi:hypothetical protein
MDPEVYTFALKNTLDEMQKVCPDIKNAFMLDQNHNIIVQDEKTTQDTLTRAVQFLNEIFEKADALDGVNGLTIEGVNGRLSVSQIEEIYLVTVTSSKADAKYVNTMAHVLVPTVLRLLEKLTVNPVEQQPLERKEKFEVETEDVSNEEPAKIEERPVREQRSFREKVIQTQTREEKIEKIIPEPAANQFIVEDMKGLLSPSDTVRVDNELIEKWNEIYEGKAIEEADIETFGGKSVRCKVKPIKDAKLEGQGKVQIPSKMQLVLDIRKGELVRVKPVVE